MAQSHHRYDAYGRPLPELTDAGQEVLYGRDQNAGQRRLLLALLEQAFHDLLRRGVYAEVHLGFCVQDGLIQTEIDETRCRHWRQPL
jgi:hypothetical protein